MQYQSAELLTRRSRLLKMALRNRGDRVVGNNFQRVLVSSAKLVRCFLPMMQRNCPWLASIFKIKMPIANIGLCKTSELKETK